MNIYRDEAGYCARARGTSEAKWEYKLWPFILRSSGYFEGWLGERTSLKY